MKLEQEVGYEIAIIPEQQYLRENADRMKCFKYSKKENDTHEI